MSTENKPGRNPVNEELSNLGRKLGDALRSVMSSPQRQEIEHDLREGFQTIVTEINEAMSKARSSEVAKEVGEQATKAIDSVRASRVGQELRDGLLKGIKALNVELDELIDKLQPASEPPAEAPDVAASETMPASAEELIDMEDPASGQS